MSDDNMKAVSNITVSYDCWKTLKIICIQKEIHLSTLVRSILEKYASKKNVEFMAEEKV